MRTSKKSGNIAAGSLDAADRISEEIYEAIHSLVDFPYTGHSRPDFTARPLRFNLNEIM
jgi:plasmid stabilization system protein ParE